MHAHHLWSLGTISNPGGLVFSIFTHSVAFLFSCLHDLNNFELSLIVQILFQFRQLLNLKNGLRGEYWCMHGYRMVFA